MSMHFHTQKEKKKEKLPEIKKQKKKKVQWIHCIYIVIIVFRNIVIETPCKGVWIPESGKFWLVESGILENFVKESGIPGRQIHNPRLSTIPLQDRLLQIKRIWSNPFKNGTILNHPTDSVRSFTCDVIALKPRPNEHDSVKKRSQKNGKTT